LAGARCGGNAGHSTRSPRQVSGGFRCMPPSLLIRWNASRRPKEAMSGYAPFGLTHPFRVASMLPNIIAIERDM
jgi:hypothetical protein